MSDIEKIKEIRERTGVGFSDCKKALVASDWDVEAALSYLREQSAVKAAKRSDRTASEGRLAIKVEVSGRRGAIVEVNSETDFAARSDRFIEFCESVASAVLEDGTHVIESLEGKRNELVQVIGENISIRRAERFETSDGLITAYLHNNGTVGAMIELSNDAGAETNKDVAMHVTAEKPLVVNSEDLPASTVENERELFRSEALAEGKPEKIVDRIIEGRLNKFKAESCLNEQPFIWDRDQKVGKYLAAKGTACTRFIRYEVGEGIDVHAD